MQRRIVSPSDYTHRSELRQYVAFVLVYLCDTHVETCMGRWCLGLCDWFPLSFRPLALFVFVLRFAKSFASRLRTFSPDNYRQLRSSN